MDSGEADLRNGFFNQQGRDKLMLSRPLKKSV